VVCAAARATISRLEQLDLGSNAGSAGSALASGLRELQSRTGHITDVRGAGLMVGCSLSVPLAAQIAEVLLREKVVVNHIGADILRFLPPLVCGTAEIDTLLEKLEAAIEEVCA
jgi:acetylornithine/succinyldiaminopimelate/putrescine aminotransferase